MDSKLVQKWRQAGLKPSNFQYFTNRPGLIIGKLPDQDAEVEYTCPFCSFYEIKTFPMEKGTTKTGKTSKKFDRPEFECSKCKKVIKVPALKNAK
ncbi:MAG: hypothetical protein HYW22_00220 [Candidatus Aenigmarchaeota archaeon]|nr:hypothetical protein [Candidatus Aenigmarchaeota archaeon]